MHINEALVTFTGRVINVSGRLSHFYFFFFFEKKSNQYGLTFNFARICGNL